MVIIACVFLAFNMKVGRVDLLRGSFASYGRLGQLAFFLHSNVFCSESVFAPLILCISIVV